MERSNLRVGVTFTTVDAVVARSETAKSAAIGLLWGVFCRAGADFFGLAALSTLFQMVAPWIWLAAIVACVYARTWTSAAALGAITLFASNFAYFGVGVGARLARSGDFDIADLRFFILWAGIGVVVGPIAGIIGRMLLLPPTAPLAAGILTGVSVAEPLAWWWHIQSGDARTTYVLAALVGLVGGATRLGTALRPASSTIAIAALAAYPMAIVLEAALIVTGQVSAPFRLI